MSKQPTDELAATGHILETGTFEFWKTTDKGITFHETTPRATWLKVVEQLCGFYEGTTAARARTLLLLGDSLNFGEAAYGEDYAQAIDGARQALGLSPSRISNVMSITKKFPASRRRDNLTIGHYDAVAGLEETDQDSLLKQAVGNDWSVSELRDEVTILFPATKRGKQRSKVKSKAKETDLTPAEAKQSAKIVSNWLTAHDGKLSSDWKPILAHIYKLYRRNFI